VGVGVAQVDGHGVIAVAGTCGGETPGGPIERLVPGNLLPTPGGVAVEGPAEAIGVRLDVLESDPLGTDVPAAEGILPVTSDGDDGTVLHPDLEATGSLAQGADPVVHAGVPRAQRNLRRTSVRSS